MPRARYFTDTIGLELRCTFVDEDGTPHNVALGATEIRLRKPDGTVVSYVGDPEGDGTDGVALALTGDGDLDRAGIYRVQGTFTLDAEHVYQSDVHEFEVEPSI